MFCGSKMFIGNKSNNISNSINKFYFKNFSNRTVMPLSSTIGSISQID